MKNTKNTNNLVSEDNIEKVIHPTKVSIDKFLSNKVSVVGLVLFLIIVLLLIFAPFITPPNGDLTNTKIKFQPPSSEHLLGTDNVGRDMLTRILYGGRVSMQVGIIASLISTVLGSMVGSISGFYGRRVDYFLMRFTEIVMTFPYLPTVITISFALQGVVTPDKKVYIVAFIIGLLSWGSLARIVRAQMLSLREQEFMQAANALGLSDSAKIFKHLLPNTVGLIMIYSMLSFSSAILSEAALSFLGLGVNPPTPSWGNILQFARNINTFKNNWWVWLPCGILLVLTVASINLFGEGLRDAFDPKSNN